MNFKQLKYVIVLSECSSFSDAADQLNISQPSLSQYIKNIENELNIQLFERTNSNIRLTDAGRIFIKAAKSILTIESDMQNKFLDLSNYKTGTISIGISPHRSFHIMPRYITEFYKMYPNIKLIIKEKSGPDLIESAQSGDFDVFITTLPLDEKIFNYKIILKEELLLATPKTSTLFKTINKKYKLSKENKLPSVDIKILNKHDFITLSNHMPTKKIELDICEEFNLTLNYVLECTSLESQISMVYTGVGSAIIPNTVANLNNSVNNVAYFSFEQNIISRDIVIAWRKDHYLSEPVKQLIDIMKM